MTTKLSCHNYKCLPQLMTFSYIILLPAFHRWKAISMERKSLLLYRYSQVGNSIESRSELCFRFFHGYMENEWCYVRQSCKIHILSPLSLFSPLSLSFSKNFQIVWVGQLSFYWSGASPWTQIHWRRARLQIGFGLKMIRKWTLQQQQHKLPERTNYTGLPRLPRTRRRVSRDSSSWYIGNTLLHLRVESSQVQRRPRDDLNCFLSPKQRVIAPKENYRRVHTWRPTKRKKKDQKEKTRNREGY